jgi:fatty acid amide hydrolase
VFTSADSRRYGSAVPATRPSATELASRLRARELSAAEAVEACIVRLEETHERLNAVVVRRFEEARREAAEADRRIAAGEPAGPLEGVPITIKESFDLAGTPSTAGLDQRRSHRAAADSPLVARLRAAGAIVLCKTNVAQLLVYHESDNPLYGRTNNPWDLERTPGGSSGGEAAVLAAGGAALGLGSDIGGSVRVPAHFCGIHGLKVTAGRLTFRGSMNELVDAPSGVLDAAGPLARSVEDLELALGVLAGEDGDPDVPPVPLRPAAEVDMGALGVGFWEQDGHFPVSPAVRRLVREAADALRAAGAEVRPFDPPAIGEAVRLYFAVMGSHGGAIWRRLLRDSRVDRRAGFPARTGLLPRPVSRTAARIAGLAGQRELAAAASAWGRRSLDAHNRLVDEWRDYRRGFAEAMDDAGVDVLLSPPYPTPALRHGTSFDMGPCWSTTLLNNLLGTPAGTVAAGRVRPDEESDRPRSPSRSMTTARKNELGSAGLPVGVQVTGRHWREDVVLAAMQALEAHFRTTPDYPAEPPL